LLTYMRVGDLSIARDPNCLSIVVRVKINSVATPAHSLKPNMD